MITPTARRILEQFAAAFPNSAHYRGGRPLRKAGWAGLMPEIERDVESKQRFLDAVDELVAAGILSVRWRRFREGDDVEALYLRDPAALFAALGTRSPTETASAMSTELSRTECPPGSLAEAVATHVAALLEANHPTPFADETELADTLRLLSLSTDEVAQQPIRALSVRLFSNSKRIEALLRTADTATRAAAGVTATEVLGLSRSYPEATIALRGTIVFSDRRRWELCGESVTLPLETAAAIEEITFDGALITVENKESFGVTAAGVGSARGGATGIGAVVYTAGHPNRAVQTVVRRAAAGGAAVRHFGDLDPEGLLIYQEIASLVPRLQPLFMDPETYNRFAAHGRPLNGKEHSLLDRITRPELTPLVERMRERRIAVEQEVIDPGADEWE
ncbi:MAG: DUF2399 domain-containing protein [Spirochaetaceae bacterium]|nr:MAG: DUF2399 domain-containing protein [Spirochaetaceae bacterium]